MKYHYKFILIIIWIHIIVYTLNKKCNFKIDHATIYSLSRHIITLLLSFNLNYPTKNCFRIFMFSRTSVEIFSRRILYSFSLKPKICQVVRLTHDLGTLFAFSSRIQNNVVLEMVKISTWENELTIPEPLLSWS